MPAQVADWSEVKATAIAVGNLREAAELHGVTYDAARQRASREEWPIGRRVHVQAAEAKALAQNAMVAQSQGRVTSVTSAADALSLVINTEGKATRISALRAVRKSVEKLEQQPEPLVITSAADLKAMLQAMQIADGSARGDNAVEVKVAIFSGLAPESAPIDI